jgi:hypothetical protein
LTPARFYTLTYVSRSQLPPDGSDPRDDLVDIVKSARLNNALHRVTGVLLFSNQCFVQVLEGAMADVEWTFEKIARDRRHRDISIVSYGQAPKRSFADWAMGCVDLADFARRGLAIDGLLTDRNPVGADFATTALMLGLRELVDFRDARQP